MGATPGLSFIYVDLNRLIRNNDLNVIYVCGPGHGSPGMVANTYLKGTYSEFYPTVSQDAEGLRKLFIQFSFSPTAIRSLPNARQRRYCSCMRSLIATCLLLVQLGPAIALGLCVAGVPKGPAELDCPMSHPKAARRATMADPAVSADATSMGEMAVDVSTVGAQRGLHCCGIDDLCMLSIPAMASPRSTLAVMGMPHRIMMSGPSSPFASERITPPSPPPNS